MQTLRLLCLNLLHLHLSDSRAPDRSRNGQAAGRPHATCRNARSSSAGSRAALTAFITRRQCARCNCHRGRPGLLRWGRSVRRRGDFRAFEATGRPQPRRLAEGRVDYSDVALRDGGGRVTLRIFECRRRAHWPAKLPITVRPSRSRSCAR
jgi:hypothetical protein